MVKTRIRRKSGERKTLKCLKRCLDEQLCNLVIKWVDRQNRIFSVLYKHKKDRKWNPKYLSVFKEFDSLSPEKKTKYEQQPDSDQACKRRFKANLRKLCKDGELEFLKDKKKFINKTTKEYYYKFSDNKNNNDTNVSLMFNNKNNNDTNDFINVPILHVDTFTDFSTGEFKPESPQTVLENGNIKDLDLFPEFNSYEENVNGEDFYLTSSNDNFKDNVDFSSIDYSGDMNVPAVEESTDIENLLEMVNAKVKVPLWSSNSFDVNQEMDITQIIEQL